MGFRHRLAVRDQLDAYTVGEFAATAAAAVPRFAIADLRVHRPFEITAASLTVQYWSTTFNPAYLVTIYLVALIIIQVFGVRGWVPAVRTRGLHEQTLILGQIWRG